MALCPITGRADGSVTFGCYNNFAKVTEPMLVLWGRILRAVPESRLLLKALAMGNPSTRQRVLDLFVKEGVDPARLELRRAMSLNMADIWPCTIRWTSPWTPFPIMGQPRRAKRCGWGRR